MRKFVRVLDNPSQLLSLLFWPSYKFHLLPSISCTGDELQPFPEDWYQHGYIESQQPVRADYVEYDEGSYDDGQRSDEGWVPRWEDDRMGMMEHPIRGTQ